VTGRPTANRARESIWTRAAALPPSGVPPVRWMISPPPRQMPSWCVAQGCQRRLRLLDRSLKSRWAHNSKAAGPSAQPPIGAGESSVTRRRRPGLIVMAARWQQDQGTGRSKRSGAPPIGAKRHCRQLIWSGSFLPWPSARRARRTVPHREVEMDRHLKKHRRLVHPLCTVHQPPGTHAAGTRSV
jgi:hypothetical protein